VFLIARSPTLGLLEETTRRPVRVLCLILLLHWDRIAKLCCPSGVVLVGVTDSVLAMLTKWFSLTPQGGGITKYNPICQPYGRCQVKLGNLQDRVPSGDDTAVGFLTYQVDGGVLDHLSSNG
jgi:hypothetical protein